MRRNAGLFVLISLLSGFGSTAMMLAAGIWVFDLTDSAGLAALIGLCLYAPTLAAPWLGALVDRLPRRALLIWTDLLLALALLSLLAVTSAAYLWLIFAVQLVRGISYVLSEAGETAILPAALPASALGDVNGWRSSAQEGTKLLAPLAGAGLYSWGGPVPVVLLSAALPLLCAICYASLRLTAAPKGAPVRGDGASAAMGDAAARAGDVRAGIGEAAVRAGDVPAGMGDVGAGAGEAPGRRREIWDGVAALFGNPAVRLPVLMAAAAIALSGLNNAAVIDRLVNGLHLPATHLGYLATAQGAGSIVGGLIVGRLLARLAPAAVAAVGVLLFAAGCLAYCLPWLPGMVTGSVLVGLGLPWALIAGVTAVQTRTPDHLLGRVGASSSTVMFGPVALTIPLGAAVVHLGARPVLVVAAALAVAVSASGIRRGAGYSGDAGAERRDGRTSGADVARARGDG